MFVFCIIVVAQTWCRFSVKTKHVFRYSLTYSLAERSERYILYDSCNRGTRWDFASSENNGNVVFLMMERRHEGKFEWLLKEIRSPKENCRLSREPFFMLWFFVEIPWNTNLAIRMYWELNLSILRRILTYICHYSSKNYAIKVKILWEK